MATKKIGLYLEECEFFKKKDRLNNEELFQQLVDCSEEEHHRLIDLIVKNNTSLIHYIIKKRYPNLHTVCQNLRVTPDDFFSAGIYAMMKAIYSFDVTKGYKFATYATMCIHNEFGMFIRRHRRSFTNVSIHSNVNTDKDGNELTLLDLLVDDSEAIEEIILQDYGFIVIEEMERVLKPKELAILRMYVSDGGDLNQREIAEKLGLSQSYISRIFNKTIKKARAIYDRLQKVV